MNREEFYYLLPYILSLALSLGISMYTWRHRQVRGARVYSWFVVGQTLTILGFIFELVSPNLQTKLLWDKFQWLTDSFLVTIPFLIFSVQFTEHKLRYPRLIWGYYLSAPVLFALLLLTDSVHHLIYPDPRLSADSPFPDLTYSFTYVVYIYSLFYLFGANIFGVSLILRRAFQTYNLYRIQLWILVIGFSIPLIMSILTLAGVHFTPQRDSAPFSLAVGNAIVAWGLFRYRLFDIVPIARERIVENINDPVIVLDARNRVADVNKAALKMLGMEDSQVIGQPSKMIFARWPIIVGEIEFLDAERKEIAVQEGDNTFYYDVNISSIYSADRQRRQLLGRIVAARDITRYKTLESGYRLLSEELERRVQERTEELRKSADQYRAVVENQTEFIVRWKIDGTRTFVNEAYCKYWGLTLAEALAINFYAHIKDEDRPEVEKKIADLIAGKFSSKTETHRIVRPDESIAWQEWTDQAIFDEFGKVVEIQSVGRDITERKRAEEALRESEERFGILSNSTFEGIALSMEGNIVDANEQLAAMFGYSRNEMIGVSVMRLIAPESMELVKRQREAEAEEAYEHLSIKKDGTIFPVEVRSRTIPYKGRIIRVTAVRDITERKKSEERLAEAYDTTLEGWAKALELRDKETEGHSRRVTESTVAIARAMGFSEEQLVHTRRGSILHDIGKMGIPDDILRKNGPLTDEERIIVQKHPKTAYDLLKGIHYLEEAIEIPYCHHEKWDGTGYPRGLKGAEIPLSARIFAIVDVWDALLSDRPYRKAWQKEKVSEYLISESGKYFDPDVVRVFMQILNKGEI